MSATHSAFKWTPLGYSQITSLAAAVDIKSGSLTTIPTDAIIALISVEGAAIRWRDDGVNPTAAIGMPMAVGQEFQYTVDDFSKIKFIQQAATATINVSYYK